MPDNKILYRAFGPTEAVLVLFYILPKLTNSSAFLRKNALKRRRELSHYTETKCCIAWRIR